MSKKKSNTRKISIALSITILLFVLLALIGYNLKNNEKKTQEQTAPPEQSQQLEENKKISLIMVGDNLIHDSIYQEANKNAAGNGYDFKPMYSMIKEIVQDYDLAYYNQETILGGTEIGLSSYPAFNSPYEVGDAMIDAGFNLVSLATNHTLDRAEQAVLNSREYWNKQENVLAVGSYSSNEERNKINIQTINDITYTMLNYTYGTNGIEIPDGKDYLVNIWPVTGSDPNNDSSYQNYKETVKEDLARVRDQVDVLIVAMHWGIEYQHTPTEYQIDAAQFLADNGVDIIIGTHPHVIEPVTWINNTLVIYSLGNFASAHEVVNIANRVGLMTSLEIEKDTQSNKITIQNVENELLYMYYTPDYTDFKIIPFSQINSNYLSNYQEVYEEYKSIVTSLNSTITVKPLS